MAKALDTLNRLLVTTLVLAILALLAGGGWLAYTTYHASRFALEDARGELAAREAEVAGLSENLKNKQNEIHELNAELDRNLEKIGDLTEDVNRKAQQIVALNEDLEAKKKEILRLETAVRLLKIDTRVAQVDILSQQGSAEDGDLVTTFSFVEVDQHGEPLAEPRVFSVEGDMIHVAALVVKFDDQYVELGDPLRSTSICLFQRIYGDAQNPKDGFVLDPVGSRPAAYATGGKPSELEQQIWERFWDYANDPEEAARAGVRAAHGEAPFQKARPGKRYKLVLRASSGLTIIPENLTREKALDPL